MYAYINSKSTASPSSKEIKMLLSTTQANEIFDILVSVGNFDNSHNYAAYKREEFVQSLTTGDGIGEYWYPSDSGSSFKLYFQQSFTSTINFVAQTYNPVHEKTIVEDMNAALNEWMSKQN